LANHVWLIIVWADHQETQGSRVASSYGRSIRESTKDGVCAAAHALAVQNIFPRMGRVRTQEEVLKALAL
jgi:hypothetical protein